MNKVLSNTEIRYLAKIGDVVDQFIDIMLNYRQSGHPGGSRSKVHAVVTLLLSGVMRWDIRKQENALGDRLVLVGGHTVPVVYATLAVLCEAMRVKYEQTKDKKYIIHDDNALYASDLMGFRHRHGLPGHAEITSKTLLLKFNTGPSGHGIAAAVGQAFALKRAGAENVKVFAIDGESAHTAGVYHEAKNSAFALGLDNLYLLLDWNDYGIDDRPISRIVYGTPETWFNSYGWRTIGTNCGNDFSEMSKLLMDMRFGHNHEKAPTCAWFRTRKGRGYLVYDSESHGRPHPLNSVSFWETKESFMQEYNVRLEGYGDSSSLTSYQALRQQFSSNLEIIADVVRCDSELVDYIADKLVKIGEQVPNAFNSGVLVPHNNPLDDPELYDFHRYPKSLYFPPGIRASTREGLGKWGAWVNAWSGKKYGRPLFLATSADLAESTRISSFGESHEDITGYGWYDRESNPKGVVLPQGITEFVNSGIMAGIATTNFSTEPHKNFCGFLGACSTYGSFAYLKYGMMRLLSQLAQDSPLKVGKVIWVVAHSGPETADDSRTHFGIFSPGVTQLFPEGKIINLYPWEPNEVPVVLGAALKTEIPIIALHLTRPLIEAPDREKKGIPSHFLAAKGAYVVRDFLPGIPKSGTVVVQGTSAMVGIYNLLDRIQKSSLNLKIVAAISHELFMRQSSLYRESVISRDDTPMIITTMARRLAKDWEHNGVMSEYTLSSDWDNNWRTGGTVEEILDEAHLTPEWIWNSLIKYVNRRSDATRS